VCYDADDADTGEEVVKVNPARSRTFARDNGDGDDFMLFITSSYVKWGNGEAGKNGASKYVAHSVHGNKWRT